MLDSMNDLSHAYQLIERANMSVQEQDLQSARNAYEQALVIFARVLGTSHEDTLTCVSDLTTVLANIAWGDDSQPAMMMNPDQDMQDALSWYQCLQGLQADAPGAQAQLERLVQQLEAKHNAPALTVAEQELLDGAARLEREADEASSRGNYVAASAALAEALEYSEQVRGRDHMDHVPLLRKQLAAAHALYQMEEILPLLQRIADIHVNVLGAGHALTIEALSKVMMYEWQEQGFGRSDIQAQLLGAIGEAQGDVPEMNMLGMLANMLTRAGTMGASMPPKDTNAKQRAAVIQVLRENPPSAVADLFDVDWSQLGHTYGAATDTPHLLLLLLSDNPADRDYAWDELYSSIMHQGDLCDTTVAVVPFMVRMLADPTTPDRDTIRDFLASLAENVSLTNPLPDAPAALQVLIDTIPLFIDLYAREPELRHTLILILGRLQEASAQIVPFLRDTFAETTDQHLKAVIQTALADLTEHSDENDQFFVQQMEHAHSAAIRVRAATALIDRMGDHAPDIAVALVLDALDDANHFVDEDNEDDWDAEDDEDQRALILTALCKLDRDRSVPLLLDRLPTLTEWDDVVKTLLALVFAPSWQPDAASLLSGISYTYSRTIDARGRSTSPPDVAMLTTQQRMVLEVLWSFAPLWRLNVDINPVGFFALPPYRMLLRAYLDGITHDDPAPPPPPMVTTNAAEMGSSDVSSQLQRIEQALSRSALKYTTSQMIIEYLKGNGILKDAWRQCVNDVYPDEQPLKISNGATLNTLDLRLLDIYLALGSGHMFIKRIAHEDRVAQAFAHIKQCQQQHSDFIDAVYVVVAISTAKDAYIANGQPTALGRLILSEVPTLADEIVQFRWSHYAYGMSSTRDIIELLLASEPPFINAAMRLVEQTRAHVYASIPDVGKMAS